MNQENLFPQETNFSPANEIPGIRAKIIGMEVGLSLVDGLRFDNFQSVEHSAVDVDIRALSSIERFLLAAAILEAWVLVGNTPWQGKRLKRKRLNT